jgi:hypothetical protein
MPDVDQFRMDKSVLVIGSLDDPDDTVAYWRSRPPEERMAALEMLRQIAYGCDPATARLQRVLEVVQRDWG